MQPFELGDGTLPFDITHFPIYVTTTQSFQSNFNDLETAWANTQKTKDITKVKMDKDDPYFASLIAAYVISHKGGFSLEHFRENTKVPNIITSIARSYVYYHMARFLQDSSKMSRFITKDDLKVIQKNIDSLQKSIGKSNVNTPKKR